MHWRLSLLNSCARPLPPLTSLLDVREERGGVYVKGAAWIRLSELKVRLSELPPPGKTFSIAALDSEADSARVFLQGGGRVAKLERDLDFTATPGEFRLWQANPFLAEIFSIIPEGIALDLGCGAGRETILLAVSGRKVIAIDHLADSIERGKRFAERNGVSDQVEWHCEDATQLDSSLINGVSFACSFFLFDRAMIRHVIEHLPTGAKLAIEAFTEVHASKFGKPSPSRFVRLGELKQFDERLKTLSHDEDWRESGRHTLRFLAEKL